MAYKIDPITGVVKWYIKDPHNHETSLRIEKETLDGIRRRTKHYIKMRRLCREYKDNLKQARAIPDNEIWKDYSINR